MKRIHNTERTVSGNCGSVNQGQYVGAANNNIFDLKNHFSTNNQWKLKPLPGQYRSMLKTPQ